MKKKLKSSKFIGILTVFLGFLVLLAICYYTYTNFFSKANIFTSEAGFFSVELPKDTYYLEREVGANSGEVYFSLKPIDANDPKGLVIYYEIPSIEGKGGVCFDANGNGAWEKVTIAGQESDKCYVDDYYSVSYPKNPIHDAEYYITSTDDLSSEDLSALISIVETGFEFK